MTQDISTETAKWQDRVSETIQQSRDNQQPLRISCGRSKLGSIKAEKQSLQELSLSNCTGVVDYDPSELYIIARAGTQLVDVTEILEQQQQCLAFEPPLHKWASIGGAVATGVTGSGMPYKGSLRNALLAVRLVNGLAEQLTFGAPVIKNVAGFDIARLMAGSYGTLGVLTEVTLRVTAIAERTITLSFQSTAQQAIERMLALDQKPISVTAQCWYQERHFVRLAGSVSAINKAQKAIGGDSLKAQAKFWHDLTRQSVPEFDTDNIILKCTCSRNLTTDFFADMQPFLIDWAGGLRWYSLSKNHYLTLLNSGLLKQLQQSDSHMWRVISPSMLLNNLVPLAPRLQQINDNIQHAFDPHNLCNPDINWHIQG